MVYHFSAGGRPGALHPCRTCNGRGIKVTITQLGPGMVQQMQSRCPDCDGEGRKFANCFFFLILVA